ncbi:MAG: anthranilate phosphoribosyltransferase [Phycisphaerales bacterium]
MQIQDVLNTLVSGSPLHPDQARFFFDRMLAGGLEPAHIGAGLAMIQQRGATVDELVAGAHAMRAHVTPVHTDPAWGVVIDTCGTGGAPKTFNVSTIAAVVAAGVEPAPARPRTLVAKHGNRSRTGRGSAELLQALGVNVDATPAQQSECLRRAGVCFCFAIHHHPATRYATPVRQALGFPTIFNLLGPLTNPAGAQRQVLGVYDAVLAEKVAHTLSRLGCERAWVLHSDDGLDELTVTADATVWDVGNAGVTRHRFTLREAQAMGLRRADLHDLRARDLDDAVRLARDVLDGANSPARDMVLLSAGAALLVAGTVGTLAEGVDASARSIDSGRARATLDALRSLSHGA